MRRTEPRIWNNYANIYGSFHNRTRTIDEIASFVQERIDAGYKPYFLTFMFNQLNGNKKTILAQMHRQIEKFNSSLITRVRRSPNSKGANDNLPILIGFADLPAIFKNTRKPLVDVVTNDGLHFHAILLIPKKSRIKGSFIDHYEKNKHVYIGDGPLDRIHVLKIKRKTSYIVQYTFKAFKWNRISWDKGFMLFPKSASETSGGARFNPDLLSSDSQKAEKKAERKRHCKKPGGAGKKKSSAKKTKRNIEPDSCRVSDWNGMSKAELRAICDAAHADWLKTHGMTVKA